MTAQMCPRSERNSAHPLAGFWQEYSFSNHPTLGEIPERVDGAVERVALGVDGRERFGAKFAGEFGE